jgi:hypothetical protein
MKIANQVTQSTIRRSQSTSQEGFTDSSTTSIKDIEHIPDPLTVIRELVRVLQVGGYLVLSTPNKLWHWPVRIAARLGLRPYDGLLHRALCDPAWNRWRVKFWLIEDDTSHPVPDYTAPAVFMAP